MPRCLNLDIHVAIYGGFHAFSPPSAARYALALCHAVTVVLTVLRNVGVCIHVYVIRLIASFSNGSVVGCGQFVGHCVQVCAPHVSGLLIK